MPAGKRIFIYSHDTFGLGHLRRCLLLAQGLAALPEVSSILIATGSPRAQAFDFPPGCDSVKLPAVAKASNGCYRSRSLGVSLDEMVRIRADLLATTVRAFCPDLVLVDHAPVGMQGELWPAFDWLQRQASRPFVVLGLRDIIDDADRVRREWDGLGAWRALDALYDRVLVYGDPAILTTASELELPDRLPEKVRFVGYLSRPAPSGACAEPAYPMILVTTGGGGDGHDVLRAYADFLRAWRGGVPFRSVIVTGPFLPDRARAEVAARCRGLQLPVEILPFVEGLDALLPAASGVVAMGGYNTVTEVLSARVPALLIPREAPRREQAIRAARLSSLAGLEWCPAADCGPDRIAGFVSRALVHGARIEPSVRLDGLAAATREIRMLLRARADMEHEGGGRRVQCAL